MKVYENGKAIDTDLPIAMKMTGKGTLMRMHSVFRFLFDFFDEMNITKSEKDIYKSNMIFREFLTDLVRERRKEIEQGIDLERGDFLTILLNDDLFKDNESIMVDECITFMRAGITTSSTMMSNALFYLTRHTEIRDKLREELKVTLNVDSLSS